MHRLNRRHVADGDEMPDRWVNFLESVAMHCRFASRVHRTSIVTAISRHRHFSRSGTTRVCFFRLDTGYTERERTRKHYFVERTVLCLGIFTYLSWRQLPCS